MISICLLCAGTASAQKSLLSQDEHNKYIYYEVVDAPGITADSLNKNSSGFITNTYPKEKPVKSDNFSINIKNKFLTYSSLTKHETGEIACALTIECKDAKYRYWITDFVYTPYEKNRYGNFVPVIGIDLPLEKATAKISQKDLDALLEQTGAFCKQAGEKLKKYMKEGDKVKKTDQQPVKKIVTDKW